MATFPEADGLRRVAATMRDVSRELPQNSAIGQALTRQATQLCLRAEQLGSRLGGAHRLDLIVVEEDPGVTRIDRPRKSGGV